jgi:metal-dependent HD superfamily phosphatase/phosphodiesterase
MPVIKYSKRISPMDIYELLKDKGVKPSDITVEEDGDEVRIIISGVELTAADLDSIDALMKIHKRKK